MRPIQAIFLVLAVTAAVAFAPTAHAGKDSVSNADMAAVHDFKLDEAFLRRYMATGDEIAEHPCKLGLMGLLKGNSDTTSLDQMAAEYDARPGVHAMLARHDLTARQMILGVAALTQAAASDMARQHPGLAGDNPAPSVSDANLRFYRAHKATLHHHMQKLAQRQLKADGGKLPSCMR